MRILVACEFPEAALEQLRGLATEVIYAPKLTTRELPDLVKDDISILAVRHLRVSASVIAQATSLQMIVHAGRGPGDIALEEASNAGVFVCDCPDQHATAIAELTLGLALALDRRIVDNAIALRESRWERDELMDAKGLADRTLGILGFGEVGRRVARRARAFDMRVMAWAPNTIHDPLRDADVEFCNYPRELARASDIVTIHAPDDAEDEQDVIVNAEFLNNLAKGAYLVHVGNPGVVDRTALEAAIKSRHLRVALDVYASEPATDSARARFPVADLPDVICTQHIGPLTQQARRATAAEVVRVVRAFLVTGNVENCLNICEHSPATWQLVLRVRDQFGVMAAVLDAIRADGINAQEISTRVFTGARAAWCTVNLDERPSTDALDAIRDLDNVLHLELRAVV